MAAFAVEVPGEAAPLSETAVESCLRAATSRHAHQIQSGTKQLQNWSTQAGYYSHLQSAFLSPSLPVEVRMLAIIQLKNGIDKHWRRAAINAVRVEERGYIRDRLLAGTLDEPNDRLADLNAIVTAKIARFDFPSRWKNLMRELIGHLQEQSSESRLLRALSITHHIVKELATIRLTVQRVAFQDAVPDLLATLEQVYNFHLQRWQSRLSEQLHAETTQAMSITERTLKVVRRLLVSGFEFPHRQEIVARFWTSTSTHVQLYLQIYYQQQIQNAYRISAVAHAKQLAKTHVGMAKDHPVSFALMPDTADLVRFYWTTAVEFRQRQLDSTTEVDDDETAVYNSFNLRAILLLRACFREAFNLGQHFRYRNEQGKDEPQKARSLLNSELLTTDFVNALFQAVVSKFFYYIRSDIEEWVTEPEEWDMKEEGDEEAYDQSVRSAAERLFLDVTIHYKHMVIEPLLDTVRNVSSSANSPALESPQLLLKDAIYSAIGVAAPILNGRFDFNTFLSTNLIADLQHSGPEYGVVRRRIATLLARWIPVDISEANRPLVYEIYQTMLDPDQPANNLSVRLTAGKRLRDVVDELTFRPESFQPYVPTMTSRLLDLIREVSLPESKLALLNTISKIVQRMGNEVILFAEQIVAILQMSWDESGSENLMKVAIVTILRRLLQSMGPAGVRLHPTVLSIIIATVSPGSELQVYLSESALELWATVLEGTPAPAGEDLLNMIQYIGPFISDEDHMQKAIQITRSYILLAPERMLHDDVRDICFLRFTDLLDVKNTTVVIHACSGLELIIRAAEAIGGEEAIQIVTKSLITTGFAAKLCTSLNQSWAHHDSSGPEKVPQPRDWKNETNYLLICSRVIWGSVSAFLYMIEDFGRTVSMTREMILKRFLDECFRHMDAVGQPTETKLIGLALTRLLGTGQPGVLEMLQDLMSLWTTMITELSEGEKGSDCLTYVRPEAVESTESPESDRATTAMYADPVHSVNLGQFVSHHLKNAIARCGGEQRFQEEWLVNVDKDVIKAFGELGIL